jgi:hypothetical protein
MKPVASGMSDAELEDACRPSITGVAPWVYWTSELYCFGKCLRVQGIYPRALPVFVYADHGVALHSNLFPHERGNSSRVHLVFHPFKEERYRDFPDKQVLRIPHPWIYYRRSRGIRHSQLASGTLVFVPHHAPGVKWENHTTGEYFESLRRLPAKYHPIVLCLHMHDVNAGIHRELRNLGFPIVTAGNTSSVDFVDRFYELVRHFAYATSQGWGSQVAYCVELGVPYFFLGERPRLINLSSKELPVGEVRFQDEHHEKYEMRAEALFRTPLEDVSAEQREFVQSLLGLDARTSRAQLSWILWREFFRNWRNWWSVWLKPGVASLWRNGVSGFVRRVAVRLRSG